MTPHGVQSAMATKTTPATPVDPSLASEGDSTAVTTADIRAALGIQDPAPASADDLPLTDEEQAAAEAELAADEEPAGEADEEPAEPAAEAEPASADLTALQAKVAAAEAARLASEGDLATSRERLAAYEAESAARTDAGVLDTVTDLESLATQRTRFVNLYAWAIKHPDGGALPDGKGGEVELSREEVAGLQADAYTLVQDGIPRREAFLRAAATREAEALNAYPWIKETSRGIGADAAKLLASAPALRRLPEAKLLAADSVIGARLRAAGIVLDESTLAKIIATVAKPAGKAAISASPARVPPASPSRAGILPPRTRGNESAVKAAAEQMQRTRGSVQSIEASILAKLSR